MGLFGPSNPVFEMLEQDHSKVKKLFDEFEAADDSRAKQRIVEITLLELDVHTEIEETLIYPAIRREIDAEKIMDEALEEHHVAHTLIDELKRGAKKDGRYEAKFKVLGESIKHHVKEEEGTMFPEAKNADLDWDALAKKAMARKKTLMSQRGAAKRRTARRTTKSGRKSLRKAA